MSLPGYDAWKTHNPEDDGWPEGEHDPNCTCKPYRADKWCPLHGLDPDEEREKLREHE